MANIGSLVAHLGVDTTGLRSAAQDFKKFETQTTAGLSSISGAVKALAASYAVLKTAELVKDATLAAARYETLGVVLNVVGNNAGYSAKEMESFTKGVQKSGIAMIESRAVITRMTQAHIDLSQSTKLARIAQDAAVIGNINSSEAFERMIYGIQSGQTEVLKTIGINVSFEESYKKLAGELGKTAKELTTLEKTQARTNVVMQAGGDIAGAYEASMGTAGKQLLSLTRYWDNFKVTAGGTFLSVLADGVSQITGELKDSEEALRANQAKLTEWGNDAHRAFQGAIEEAGLLFQAAKDVVSAFATWDQIVTMITAVGSALRNLVHSMEGAAAVMAGRISFFDYATSNAEELHKKLVESRTDTGLLKTEHDKLIAALANEQQYAAFSPAEKSAKAERINVLKKELASINEQTQALKDNAAQQERVAALYRKGQTFAQMEQAQQQNAYGGMIALPGLDMAEVARVNSANKDNAAQKAREDAEAAITAGAKLAEQWKKTKLALEQEIKLSGLTGLEKTLQEITNRAEEYREQFGKKPEIKAWEESTKAIATERDELERLGKQWEIYFENVEQKTKIKEDYNALVIDMLPAEGRAVALVAEEYKKKQQILNDAVNAGQITADVFEAQSAKLAIREAQANEKAIESFKKKSSAIEDIMKNMYQSLQSLTAGWLEKMEVSWDSLKDLFKKMVAQMVSAWAWGQAQMAWAGTTPDGSSSGTTDFSLARVGNAAAGLAGVAQIGSMSAGYTSPGNSLATAGIGLAGVGIEAYQGTTGASMAALQQGVARVASAIGLGTVQGLQSGITASWSSAAGAAGYDAVALSAEAAGAEAAAGSGIAGQISAMSSAAFAGWASGISTFVIGLLRRQSFMDAALQGIGAGLGAWGGATIGTMILPGVGTVIGAIIGSTIGSWVGSLFGSGGKENQFTLTELVQPGIIVDTIFEKTRGLEAMGWQHGPGGNQWYAPVANAYSQVVDTIHSSFTENVFAFAESMPDTLESLFLDKIAATDYSSLLSEASGGRWGISGASGALEGVAQRYADLLATAASDAYTAAIADFFATASPAEMLGSELEGTWDLLTDAAQAHVKSLFVKAGQAVTEGGLEAGLTEVGKIAQAMQELQNALAPIQEIIDTQGMSEYELSLRHINQQFDDYGASLQAAGVDLMRYTDLEVARGIALAQVVNPAVQEAIDLEKEHAATRLSVQNQIDILEGRTTQDAIDRAAALAEASTSGDTALMGLLTALYGLQDAADTAAASTETARQATETAADTIAMAQVDLQRAYEVEAAAFQGTIDQFSQFGVALRRFKRELLTSDLSTLSPLEKYNEARRQFEDISRRSQLGDATAIMELQGVSQSFLEASRGYFASTDQYVTDFAAVTAVLDTTADVADRTVTIAQDNLDALKAQTAYFIDINESVLSVVDAIANLGTAVTTAIATGVAPTGLNNILTGLSGGATGELTQTGTGSIYRSGAGASLVYSGQDPDMQSRIYGKTGGMATVQQATDFIAQAQARGDTRAIYDAAMAVGVSLSDVDRLGGWMPGMMDAWAAGQGLPSFAVGTDFVPRDMTAKIHHGERITPAAYNRSDATNEELAKLLRDIIMELKTDKSQRGAVGTATLEKFDVVVERLDRQTRTLDRRSAA